MVSRRAATTDFRAYYAARCLSCALNPDSDEGKRVKKLKVDWFLESLSDGTYHRGEERIALLSFPNMSGFGDAGPFMSKEWENYLPAVIENQKIDHYVKDTILAECYLNRAWQARGRGWSSEVTEKGWREFEKATKAARKPVAEACRLHPEYPEAARYMIELAALGYAGPEDTPKRWFDRATKAQIDYLPAYQTYFHFQLPRWGGSIALLNRAGVDCLKTGRFDTDAPWQYFVALRDYVTNDTDGDKSYWRKPETAKYLQMMFDGYANPAEPRLPTTSPITQLCVIHVRDTPMRDAS